MLSQLQARVLENKLLFKGHNALLVSVSPDNSVRLLALRPDTPKRGRARTRDGSKRTRVPTVIK